MFFHKYQVDEYAILNYSIFTFSLKYSYKLINVGEEDQLCDYNHTRTLKPSGKSEECSGFESSPSDSFFSPGVLKEIDEIIYRRTKKKLDFMDENPTGAGNDICSSTSTRCSPYMNKVVSVTSKIHDIEIYICKSILCSNRNIR